VKRLAVLAILAIVLAACASRPGPPALATVSPEGVGLAWRECEAGVPNFDLQEACFGQRFLRRTAAEEAGRGTRDGDALRLSIGADTYEALDVGLGLCVYLKNGRPVSLLRSEQPEGWPAAISLVDVGGKAALEFDRDGHMTTVSHNGASMAVHDGRATILYDGQDVCSLYGLDAAYRPYEMAGKLLFIARKDGRYFIVYDGRRMGPVFDCIALANRGGPDPSLPQCGGGRFWFWGLRGGQLYAVEVADPGAEQPPAVTDVTSVTVSRLQRVQDLCCPPRFGPNGDNYLTVRDGSLWLHSLASGSERKLVDNVLTADWAGRAIIFTRRGQGPAAEVWLLDQGTGQARRIGETLNPSRFVFDARGRLAVAAEDGFDLLDLASGERSALPLIQARSPDSQEWTELAFSPDGRHVAALEGTALSIVDLERQGKVLVSERIDPRRWGAFAWSGDGGQLAYATVSQERTPELWLVKADGSGAQRIVARGEGGVFAGLAWLPGTRFIVYQSVPGGNVATLQAEYQVVSADGGEPTTLFKNGLGLNLALNGKVISFVRDLPGAEETGYWMAVLSYYAAP